MVEAVDWLGATFDRAGAAVVRMGFGLVLVLAGAVMVARPLALALPSVEVPEALPRRVFWVLALVPTLVVPLIAVWIEVGALPVLVADYLAVHLGLYGAFVLGGAVVAGWRPEGRAGSGDWRWRRLASGCLGC